MQPIYKDKHGVIRFKENKIITWLLETGKIDLNEIARTFVNQKSCKEDMEQFWQMLGYSVSGYGDLSFVRRKTIAEADMIAEEVREKVRNGKAKT